MKTVTPEDWIAALRSGKYKQGRNLLRTFENDTFCCLGVLCDIHDDGAWEYGGWRGYKAFPPPDLSGLKNVAGLFDISQSEWADLGLPPEEYEDDTSLAVLNDKYEFSFEQIADVIEKFKERIFHDV